MLKTPPSHIGAVGAFSLSAVQRLGQATLFLGQVLRHSGTSFMRPSLTVREVYFAGAMSLIIIMVSGLFVGMVLGLQQR